MMIRTLTILVFLGLTGFGTARAEQSDSISKKCEKEICYPCCMATCNREQKEAYGSQAFDLPAAPTNDATKATN